uniref:rRNA methyltransferase 1, mitochondrial n=1 Tax=Parascaris univalens TaxID=6257 RepID=A0A915AL34_PARUN
MYSSCLSKWRKFHRVESRRTAVDLLKVYAEKFVRRRTLNDDYRGYNSAFQKALNAGVDINAYCKRSRSVMVPKVRGEIVYGTYPVFEALKANRRRIYKLFAKASVRGRAKQDDIIAEKILRLANDNGVDIKTLNADQLDVLTEYQLHNGLCIDASPLAYEELCDNDIVKGKIFPYLDNVLDPGNIGAIIRSCFYFGIDGVILARDQGPKTLTSAMSKASAGALERFPVYTVEDFPSLRKRLRNVGFKFIATSDENSAITKGYQSPIRLPDFRPISDKVVIFLGDERRGIATDILGQCDYIVQIPTPSMECADCSIRSLNVSVSAAILLYHFLAKK